MPGHDYRCPGDCWHCGGIKGVDIGIGFMPCLYCNGSGTCPGCGDDFWDDDYEEILCKWRADPANLEPWFSASLDGGSFSEEDQRVAGGSLHVGDD